MTSAATAPIPAGPTKASMAFVLLQFGDVQSNVKEALTKLNVGQFIEMRLDF